MTEVTYNGWANYSTWRIRLELFDGWDVSAGPVTAEEIKCIAEDQIEFSSEEGPARDYAMAFISDVDWREIAESINQSGWAARNSRMEWIEWGKENEIDHTLLGWAKDNKPDNTNPYIFNPNRSRNSFVEPRSLILFEDEMDKADPAVKTALNRLLATN